MTDRAPRPEGMSDERLNKLERKLRAIVATHVDCDEWCRAQAEVEAANEALEVIDDNRRLRADGATLRERVGVERVGIVLEIQRALGVEPSGDTFERIAELVKAEADVKMLRERVNADRLLDSERDELREWLATANPTFRARVMKAVKPIGETVRIDIRNASAPKEPT